MSRNRTLVQCVALCTLFLFTLPILNAYVLNPSRQVISLPATIEFTFSADVNLVSGTLIDETGSTVRTYDATSFTGGGMTYRVTISDLLPGTYQLVLEYTEAVGDQTPGTDVVEFEYFPSDLGLNTHLERTGLNVLDATPKANSPLGETVPETGFALSTPYDASFVTTEPAWCYYSTYELPSYDPSFMTPFPTGGSPGSPTSAHEVTGLQSIFEPFVVRCDNDDSSIITTFALGYEDTVPTFTINVEPAVVVDPSNMRVNVTVTATQKVSCDVEVDGQHVLFASRYNLDDGDAGAYLYQSWGELVFGERPTTPVNKTLVVTCKNRAGLEAAKSTSALIDLAFEPRLELTSPGAYTNQQSFDFTVQAVRLGEALQSATCFFNDDTPATLTSSDGVAYTTALSGYVPGNYTFDTSCVIAGGEEVRENLRVSVDTTPPPTPSLNVPAYICGAERLTATLNYSFDTAQDANFGGYEYALTYTTGNVVLEEGTSGAHTIIATLDPVVNRSYRWSITPFDLAGNRGDTVTGETTMLEEGDQRCDKTPPYTGHDVEETLVGTVVTVWCNDTEGGTGCSDSFAYDKLPANATSNDCTYTNIDLLSRSITFYENGSLCYQVSDLNDNKATGFGLITASTGGPPPSEYCVNQVLDDEWGETGIDCGGECPACADGESCDRNADCTSGWCNPATNTCEVTSCTDGAQNGAESDVDCGGNTCDQCANGDTCDTNTDCTSDYCDRNTRVCAEEPAPSAACDTNADCEFGEECVDNECDAINVESECADDLDCAVGEVCVDGNCHDESSSTGDKGFSFVGILLVLFGLLVMAGSGYWLYTLHQGREAEARASAAAAAAPAYQPRPQELSPEQRLALAQQRKAQIDALKARRDAAAAHANKRAVAHASLTDAFDENAESGGEKSSETRSTPSSTTLATKKSTSNVGPKLDAGVDADFVDVRDLGQDEALYTSDEQVGSRAEEPVLNAEDEGEAFDDLDALLVEKKKPRKDTGDEK